ncbi:hypothetical protein RHGRI_033627 [Rhododendron griersonianum]|uniref:DUF569 domain-containing protein n=1 Tax=Rhododendron griersonianum TaxID=479676 RepID=A0AAV6I0M0_9ERIC|nr:hypothetical protein RHGRI_033627 [Rhododendron griersonianum]
MEIWHLVVVAVVTVIVEGVMHLIFYALWGFVSPKLGRLWQRLAHLKEAQAAPVLLLDQGREIQSVMKVLFPNPKAVRLRGNHNKYLCAGEDEISVTQDESGSSENVCWTVEFCSELEDKIRLKSCYGKYLTASNKRFLFGLTGRKVLQMAGCLDSSVEWQPIQEGNWVKLRTRDGSFLRANGGVPPWQDSVTHDVPWVLQDLVLWDVDVVEIVSKQLPQPGVQLKSSESWSSSESNYRHNSRSFVRQEIQTVMNLFPNAKVVRLRSNHNKYLCAEEDEISVTQEESGSSENVCWTVEFSSESEDKIRLKSCYGKYLTASNKRFLLGLTGHKVLQMAGCLDSSVEWQPIQEGNQVKLRTRDGNFLRANGGVAPWQDSVTHDIPWVLQDLVLWDVDVVEIVSEQSSQPSIRLESSKSWLSSELNHRHKSPSFGRQEVSMNNTQKSKSQTSRIPSNKKIQSVMELFRNAKTVRLRGKHKKYLSAREDKKTVIQVAQDESGFLKNACWTVEFSSESENKIRLKSCYDKYLTASNKRFLLSVTGCKVLQTASCLDSSVEWQLVQKGNQVKLMTWDGNFLRANDSRDSVTHDVPIRKSKQDLVLWDVDVVEIVSEQSSRPIKPGVQLESLEFGGNGRLEVETGLEDIIVCSRSSMNTLYTLRSQLPPENVDMHVVVVQSSSRGYPVAFRLLATIFFSNISLRERERERDMEIWHLVVVAVETIVEGVMHLIFNAFWGFVSPKLGRLWRWLAHQKEPQAAPVLLRDQGREIQTVMNLFPNAKAMRLRGNHNKYLCAEEDKISVTQDESGSSENVCWTVEFCSESEDKIRLKSCYGKYLTASNKRFLFGLTGRKVLQMAGCLDSSVEWQPIQEGNSVKLRTRDGNFLRANGGISPWQDSVTHDVPWVLQDLVLWDVDVVASEQLPQPGSQLESSESWSSSESNYRHNSRSFVRQEIQTVMNLFPNGNAVRLRGNHNKYLCAEEDEISVTQDESSSSKNVCWTVEFSSESEDKIRLKSCYGKYLTASNKRFLLGLTGRKVLQMAGCLNSSVEWQPIQEGNRVKLRTRNGNFLRANGGVAPWRDSVTHDIPWVLEDLVLWDVDVVEIVSEQSPQSGVQLKSLDSWSSSESWPSSESNHQHHSPSFVRQEIQSVMELFRTAKTVRLRGKHKKYLSAKEDEKTVTQVTQDESGFLKNACWTVEFSSESENKIRLKSCYGKYLTASNKHSLLSMTGRKVLQMASCLDSSVEWQLIQEGNRVKLRTRDGNFLRANNDSKDSVTHDDPMRKSKQDRVLWDVDVVEIVSE